VKCSKFKINQQAQIISEQSILLRRGNCPPPFHLSNNSDYHHLTASGPFPEPDQSLLPPEAARTNESTADDTKVASRPQAQHMLYSHAHNNPAKEAFKITTKTDDSSISGKVLSLNIVPSRRVTRPQGNVNKDLVETAVANGGVSDSGSDSETMDYSGDHSGEVSPSFLTDAANISMTASVIGASKENPLEIEDPMSCSMFSMYAQTSMTEAKHTSKPPPAILARKRKKNLDEIAQKLNRSKRVRDQSVERSPLEPNVIPVTPGVKIKAASVQKRPTSHFMEPVTKACPVRELFSKLRHLALARL